MYLLFLRLHLKKFICDYNIYESKSNFFAYENNMVPIIQHTILNFKKYHYYFDNFDFTIYHNSMTGEFYKKGNRSQFKHACRAHNYGISWHYLLPNDFLDFYETFYYDKNEFYQM